jgi:hypothetical protein
MFERGSLIHWTFEGGLVLADQLRRRADAPRLEEHRPVRAKLDGFRIFVGGGVSYLAEDRHVFLPV